MRSLQLRSPSFAVGFTLGLVLTGVTFAFSRFVQRRSARRAESEGARHLLHPVIDGAKPINPVDLTVGPPTEPGAGAIRLESELDEPRDNSQRW